MLEPSAMCAICCKEFDYADVVVVLECSRSHAFHHECMEQRLDKKQHSCPLCLKRLKSRELTQV